MNETRNDRKTSEYFQMEKIFFFFSFVGVGAENRGFGGGGVLYMVFAAA
jgi:hypothetical protein